MELNLFSDETDDWNRPVPTVEVCGDDLERYEDAYVYQGKLFDGIAVFYWPEGQLDARIPCLNGLPHGGPCRRWYRNGQLSEEWAAFHGMGHGPLLQWFQNGSLKREELTLFGRPMQWTEYDESGKEIDRGENWGSKYAIKHIEEHTLMYPNAPKFDMPIAIPSCN